MLIISEGVVAKRSLQAACMLARGMCTRTGTRTRDSSNVHGRSELEVLHGSLYLNEIYPPLKLSQPPGGRGPPG